MVTLGKDFVIKIESCTHCNKSAFEWGAIIYYNKMTQAKFHENVLEEILSECSRGFVSNWYNNNEL